MTALLTEMILVSHFVPTNITPLSTKWSVNPMYPHFYMYLFKHIIDWLAIYGDLPGTVLLGAYGFSLSTYVVSRI